MVRIPCTISRSYPVGMVNAIQRSSSLLYHLHTLFLFTQADIITSLVSQTVFALAVAPVCHLSHIFHVAAWIWLHLLQCNVANQVRSPDEDKINKPSRPFSSGRITGSQAKILRWALVPVCLAVSAAYSAPLFFTSLTLSTFNVVYNECNGHASYLSKSSLTAVMYSCAGFGGTIVAGCDRSHIPESAWLPALLYTVVFASTLHAQDFRDVSGDLMTGRRTLPIAFPLGARISVALGIPLWSVCLSHVWGLDPPSVTAFASYSAYTGARFLLYRSLDDDKRSCDFYSIWFSINNLLPAYWHICMATSSIWLLTPSLKWSSDDCFP